MRSRSKTPEHQERCAQRFGSARKARRQCARCGWIANRERRHISSSRIVVVVRRGSKTAMNTCARQAPEAPVLLRCLGLEAALGARESGCLAATSYYS